MQNKVVIVGNASIDSVVTEDGVLYPNLLGGNAFHASMSASIFHEAVGTLAVIPKNFPRDSFPLFEQRGVDLGALVEVDEKVEAVELFLYDAQGDRKELLTSYDGQVIGPKKLTQEELESLSNTKVAESLVSFTDFRSRHRVHAQYLPEHWHALSLHLAPTALATHRELIELGCPLITLDPGSYLKGMDLASVIDLINSVTVFMPSKKEMSWIFGELSALDALRILAKHCISSIICKNGKQGCYVYSSEERAIYEVGTYPAVVADYTGAGDFFCAAVNTQLLRGSSVLDAARIATVTSARAIEHFSIAGRAHIQKGTILGEEKKVPYKKLEDV